MAGQVDIICKEFKAISERTFSGSSKFTLKMLIEKHNKLILFFDDIEKLFSLIALMEVVWNTLVGCCLGFICIVVSIVEIFF